MVEIHFHGPLFARHESSQASAPSDNHERADGSEDVEVESDDAGGRSPALPAVFVLALIVGFAYAARRLRSDDGQTTLEESAD